MLLAFVATGIVGCSDDDDAARQNGVYGYVQFKLYKEASYSRAVDRLDKLSDAHKMKVMLQNDNTTITQTLQLNAYNKENAEFGLRSDKMKLVEGDYKLIGYSLLDSKEQLLLSADVNDCAFTIVTGGLHSQDIAVAAAPRGRVSFRIVKNLTGAASRAIGEDGSFPISDIAAVDVTVQNTFTLEKTTFKTIKAKYTEDFYTNRPAGENDQTAYVKCDTVVWLPAGEYKVLSFMAYSDKKAKKAIDEVYNTTSKTFVVTDNELTENVEVPFDIKGTEEYIKDYFALKAIWEALDGPSWKYVGEVEAKGCNWNFDKDVDMWGNQPGVQLHSDGRVASVSLEGFGVKGYIPAAIGQLTELAILYLGSHSETLGGHLFPNMNEEEKKSVRMDYNDRFLEKDFRAALSDDWQKSIELDPSQKPIRKSAELKHIMFGDSTNLIRGVSKAIMRCTKLEQFYIANSPIRSEEFFTPLDKEDSEYARMYAAEESEWSWENMVGLSDIEIYNCPNMTYLPMEMLASLPDLQMLNIACLKGISGEQLLSDWNACRDGKSGDRIQGIYMGYNNLVEFPKHEKLKKMVKLGLLDLTNNKIEKLEAFGKDVNLAKIYLDYNKIKKVPNVDGYFCGFEQLESFNISNNEIEEFPDIFDARSIIKGESIDFSYNKISSFENGDNSRGVNIHQVNLAGNRLKTFPGVLFKKNSPINYLVLSGNGMETIPEGSLKGDNAYLLEAIDLSYNKLSDLPDDFYARNLPYLTGIDISYNSFSSFPTEPLSVSGLVRYFIRYQSDEKGNRCLREWPTGLWQHIGLRYFLIGGNDLRKITDTMPSSLFYFEIADNPNITIDVSSICTYLSYGYILLIYDKTQDIRGCDALELEN